MFLSLFNKTRKKDDYRYNPYIFDTFDIDGDNSARLDTCRLQYGTKCYPELEYDHDFKIRILNDLINFRYRKERLQHRRSAADC